MGKNCYFCKPLSLFSFLKLNIKLCLAVDVTVCADHFSVFYRRYCMRASFSLSSACREPGLSQESMLFDRTGRGGGEKSLLKLIKKKFFF